MKHLAFVLALVAGAAFGANIDAWTVDYPLSQPLAWWPINEGSGTSSTADRSGHGHTATLNNIEEGDWVAGPSGIGYALNLDGANESASLADTDAFSFTNGSNDLPFSVGVCASLTTAANTALISKTSTLSQLEWSLYTTSGSTLHMIMYSGNSTADRVGAETSSALTAYEGAYHSYIATYDGSESYTGITIYIDGSAAATVPDNHGTYVTMSNSTAALYIGAFLANESSYKKFAQGKFSEAIVDNRGWTADEVSVIAARCRD